MIGGLALKALDVVVGLKLMGRPNLAQAELAKQIGSNPAQVTRAIKSLLKANLFYPMEGRLIANFYGWEKILLAIEYLFPVSVGGIVIGMPTSYGAPPISNEINPGSDPIPIWPCAKAGVKGLCVEPLYSGTPKALIEYPDEDLYTLLALIDALRMGRSREKELGRKYILEKLKVLKNRGSV
jgi:hypothetical protein